MAATDWLYGLDDSHLSDWCDTRGPVPRIWRLHRDTVADWQRLVDAAAADGLHIAAVSSFRDFHRQAAIWNDKFSGRRPVLDDQDQPLSRAAFSAREWLHRILRFSALPGLSRHHWGSDLDVFDATAITAGYRPQLIASEFSATGPCASLDCWLRANAGRFGFFRPYDLDRGGVAPEPWHLSHAAVAEPALAALDIARLRSHLHAARPEALPLLIVELPLIVDRYARNIGSLSRA